MAVALEGSLHNAFCKKDPFCLVLQPVGAISKVIADFNYTGDPLSIDLYLFSEKYFFKQRHASTFTETSRKIKSSKFQLFRLNIIHIFESPGSEDINRRNMAIFYPWLLTACDTFQAALKRYCQR